MDDAGCRTMSAKELNRLEIRGRVLERRLTQAQAARQLGLSVRQVERLCGKLRIEGPCGLVSKKRGRASRVHLRSWHARIVSVERTGRRRGPGRDAPCRVTPRGAEASPFQSAAGRSRRR